MDRITNESRYNNIIYEEIGEKGYSMKEFYKYVYYENHPEFSDGVFTEDIVRVLIKKFKEKKEKEEIKSSNEPTKQPRNPQIIITKKGNNYLSSSTIDKVIITKNIEVDIYGNKYKIETPSNKWNVKKKYEDFQILRYTWEELEPYQLIPIIPKQEDEDNYNNIYFLQNMLDCMIVNKKINNRYDFISFLESSNTHTPISYIYHSLRKEKQLLDFSMLTTPEGMITVSSSPEKEWNDILKYANEVPLIYDKIIKEINTLHYQLDKVRHSIGNIRSIINELEDFNNTIFMKKELMKCFDNISNVVYKWREMIDNQDYLIRNKLSKFFKALSYQVIPLKGFCESANNLRVKYKKQKEILEKKKEKAFKKKKIQKWGIDNMEGINFNKLLDNKELALRLMFTKETKELRQLKENAEFEDQNLNEMLEVLADYQIKAFETFFTDTAQFCNKFLFPNFQTLYSKIQEYSQQNNNIDIK